ncbi:MAG: ABC transporter permease [Acidimicrobiaceae bacterium]|nr:ABC transporter permease [Acidimicrobiaceae bacterium]MDE0664276.1 ABC transporter permease [Acidimicrobiaceae bacterium]MXY09714.1 ABC transporter permease [Acidimicrobiaceae bacterium]MXZ65907.1 ABC transporter permease [Acidimicrobiaceae bacterium]MYE57674.1 ABC transporter permease [Acidimicrobiaceae bacterium]
MGGFFSAIGDVVTNEVTYSGAMRFAALLAFAAIGETIAEKAGTLNISLEGMVLGGAFAGALGMHLTESVSVGLVFATVIGTVVASVQANMSHRLTANQFVVGLALNTLVLGIASFLNTSIQPVSKAAHRFAIKPLSELPLIGDAFFNQPWPLYLVYPMIPAAWWLLYRTRWGLEVRAVGENPQSADVSGIDVNKRRRQSIYIAGLTSGLGGGYLVLGQIGRFEDAVVGGQGFIAIAAVIFGGWTMRGVIGGCLLFGTVNSFRLTLPTVGHELNSELLSAAPFVVTIVTVTFFAHRTREPRALAQPFVRGLT